MERVEGEKEMRTEGRSTNGKEKIEGKEGERRGEERERDEDGG